MPSATSLLVALVVIALIGALGTLYFWTIRRRQDEALNGVRALSAMRWREFSHFVIDAMRHRGYDVITTDDEVDRGQQTEFLLTRNGERAVLGCKHGSAYKLSKQSVAEFVGAMKFQGARSGLLVTPGSIDPDARKAAEEARVELIDGSALWPEIAPLLPQSLAEDVRKDASQRARRMVWISWVGALVVGLAVGWMVGAKDAPPPNDTIVIRRPAGASARRTREGRHVTRGARGAGRRRHARDHRGRRTAARGSHPPRVVAARRLSRDVVDEVDAAGAGRRNHDRTLRRGLHGADALRDLAHRARVPGAAGEQRAEPRFKQCATL